MIVRQDVRGYIVLMVLVELSDILLYQFCKTVQLNVGVVCITEEGNLTSKRRNMPLNLWLLTDGHQPGVYDYPQLDLEGTCHVFGKCAQRGGNSFAVVKFSVSFERHVFFFYPHSRCPLIRGQVKRVKRGIEWVLWMMPDRLCLGRSLEQK